MTRKRTTKGTAMTEKFFGFMAGTAISGIVLGSVSMMLLWQPLVGPWSETQRGVAEFNRAEQNRQIRTQEAIARSEAAVYLAEAEVIKARGVAEANAIMSASLGGPEGYLRWKYIEMLEETGQDGNTIVYIPTEATLPILEAGRVVDATAVDIETE